MSEVKLNVNSKGEGAFNLMEDMEKKGEMVVRIDGALLTVYHTEVAAQDEGKGFAKKMLDSMANYARQDGLKVVPLCPYVHAQFKRHPDEYADIWYR